MSFDLKGMLSTIAPTIATVIGGPLAGTAVRAGLNALGVTPQEGQEQEQLASAVAKATPEQLLKLKEADQAFKVQLKKLGLEAEKIAAHDRDSARQMAAKTGKEPQVVLSVAYTIAYGVVMYCFMAGKVAVPDQQQILFGSLIGILTAAQVQILNFWFGSSAGSKDKTRIIGEGQHG